MLGSPREPPRRASREGQEPAPALRPGDVLVFVYGSLMVGGQNHDLLRSSRWVGPARTEPRYRLWDLGEYPAMVEGGDVAVVGELYAVDAATLEALDELEESPEVYQRVSVFLERGGVAQGYVGRASECRCGREIRGGSWRRYCEARASEASTR